MGSFAANCSIDVAKLLETRMLIQASSGGDKPLAANDILFPENMP